jgi:hypothetical protein
VESVQATGIRFFSLVDAGDTVEMRRKLWHVNYQTHLDDPASAGTFPSFDEMTDIWAAAEWFVPEGQILAAQPQPGIFRLVNDLKAASG